MSGIVDELPINPKLGLYTWSTRHIVIARKITEYKFSSVDELRSLFERIIANIVPSFQTELQSIRDLCDTDFGIGRLGDAGLRKSLYRKLIEIAPAERIPWHRYIRELLDEGNFEQASYAIRDAIYAAGVDAPISRYSVRLQVLRSERTPGISDADRLAILRRSYEMAFKNVDSYRYDKNSYRVLCEVATKLVERGEPVQLLDEALEKMQQGAANILDPDMDSMLRRYEQNRRRLT